MVGEAENARNWGTHSHPSPQPSKRTDLGREGTRAKVCVEGIRSHWSASPKTSFCLWFHVFKVKNRACHVLVDEFDVIVGCLKVCGSIIGAGTEHVALGTSSQ